jgi:hypothetical protein
MFGACGQMEAGARTDAITPAGSKYGADRPMAAPIAGGCRSGRRAAPATRSA